MKIKSIILDSTKVCKIETIHAITIDDDVSSDGIIKFKPHSIWSSKHTAEQVAKSLRDGYGIQPPQRESVLINPFLIANRIAIHNIRNTIILDYQFEINVIYFVILNDEQIYYLSESPQDAEKKAENLKNNKTFTSSDKDEIRIVEMKKNSFPIPSYSENSNEITKYHRVINDKGLLYYNKVLNEH